jgi:putative oxidoreductase
VLLALRLMIAAIFLSAGYAKWGFWTAAPEGMSAGMANLMKFLSIVEPLGGIALIAGFLTRWAAAGLAIIMVGAIFILQFTMQVGFTTAQGSGWDFPLTILGGCLVLMTFGAGRWSAESICNSRKSTVGS